MTAGILKAASDMTGGEVRTCPWRAFSDPFVQRVVELFRFYEKGQAAFRAPNPSHRLMQGLAFFSTAWERMQARQREIEMERAKKNVPSGGMHGR